MKTGVKSKTRSKSCMLSTNSNSLRLKTNFRSLNWKGKAAVFFEMLATVLMQGLHV